MFTWRISLNQDNAQTATTMQHLTTSSWDVTDQLPYRPDFIANYNNLFQDLKSNATW